MVIEARSLFRTLLAAAIVAAGTLGTSTASAQSPAPKACPDKDKAKRDFVKGRLAYRRGNYEEAILKWQDSYAACAKPLTLFNIGNAYERLGELKAALKHFEQYRPVAEKHEHADLDSRMATLRSRIAEQERLDAEQRARDEAARKAEEDRQRLAAQQANQNPDAGTPQGTNYAPIIGWSAIGVGGAAVIAGVVMDVVAASTRPEESEACVDTGGRLLCSDAQRDDINTSNTLAIAGDITWIAGSVFVAGGATVLILWTTGAVSFTPRNSAVRVAPYGPGLQVSGTF